MVQSTLQSNSLSSANYGKAILWGALVSGVLDATDGIIAFGLKGKNPIQVLQYIASGSIGSSAYQLGLASAGLGLILHFFIAFVLAGIYVAAFAKLQAIRRNVDGYGLLFGALAYLTMSYVVLPLSAVAPSPFEWPLFINGIVGHAFFVGLPIARYAAKYL